MTHNGHDYEVIYDSAHWIRLQNLRIQAIKIMKTFAGYHLSPAIYGSVARGDVTPKSDIDLIISHVTSSLTVELALKMNGFQIFTRRIAQATPRHTPKAHLFLDPLEQQCVTFPLAPFLQSEIEFYKFGGFASVADLNNGHRVHGCDKRLMLICPTPKGHLESLIRGRESEVANILGVSPELVYERVRVLTRREEMGRTGLVLSVNLRRDEVFEEVLKRVADSNPILKRRLKRSGM